jgi:hypothetical protein
MDALEFGTPDRKHQLSVWSLLRVNRSSLIVGQLPLATLTTKRIDVLQLDMIMEISNFLILRQTACVGTPTSQTVYAEWSSIGKT